MNETSHRRIVLAYSGDLDTTMAIPWLTERYGAEVVTVTLDLGQEADLTDVRESALASGAVRAHVIDAREEFARDYLIPALQADALYDGRHPLGMPLSRALIARRLVEIARMEGATAIAHGSGGSDTAYTGGDAVTVVRSPLDVALRALQPSFTVLAPAALWGMSRTDRVEYARARSIYVPALTERSNVLDVNVWGRAVKCDSLPDAGVDIPESAYALTRSARDCPDEPAYIGIEFDAGVPVRANGIEMPLVELIESLDIIGGAHGVGRTVMRVGSGVPRVSNQPDLSTPALKGGPTASNPTTGDAVVFEAPAACVLHSAHRELERLVLPSDLYRAKEGLARLYSDAVFEGRWFSPAREAVDGFVRALQPRVTGSVQLQLLRGDCRVVEVLEGTIESRRQPDADGMRDPAAAGGLVS